MQEFSSVVSVIVLILNYNIVLLRLLYNNLSYVIIIFVNDLNKPKVVLKNSVLKEFCTAEPEKLSTPRNFN